MDITIKHRSRAKRFAASLPKDQALATLEEIVVAEEMMRTERAREPEASMVIHQSTKERAHVRVQHDKPWERQPARSTQPPPTSKVRGQPEFTPEAVGTWAAENKEGRVLCQANQAKQWQAGKRDTKEDIRCWGPTSGMDGSRQPTVGQQTAETEQQSDCPDSLWRSDRHSLHHDSSKTTSVRASAATRPPQDTIDATEAEAEQRTAALDVPSGSEGQGESKADGECYTALADILVRVENMQTEAPTQMRRAQATWIALAAAP